MTAYSIETREAFEKPYLSIDLANLALLPVLKEQLSLLDQVKTVNISQGKRNHLTVYPQKFYSVDDCRKAVDAFLSKFDDTKQPAALDCSEPKDADVVAPPVIPIKDNEIEEDPSGVISAVDFTPKPSQLDNIPEGYPVVFISYAHNGDDMEKWIMRLCEDLTDPGGIYVLCDIYNDAGEDIVRFMKIGIKRADRVLVIGTPKYMEKLENMESNGAKYEDSLISTSLYAEYGS